MSCFSARFEKVQAKIKQGRVGPAPFQVKKKAVSPKKLPEKKPRPHYTRDDGPGKMEDLDKSDSKYDRSYFIF